jgi:hypothetical protein
MRTLVISFSVLLFSLTSQAQSITSASTSTSYNTVTVTLTADGGWSSDFDSNCPNRNETYPYALGIITWQVDGGPTGTVSSSNITQTSYAQECSSSRYPDNTYNVQFSFADTGPGNRNVTITVPFEEDYGGNGGTQETTQLGYSVPGAIGQPKYYIVEIVYDPPGNASTNGFTNSASNGTSDSVTSTFTTDTSTTFSGGILGSGTEFTFGSSVQNGSSQAFQETHSSGYGSSIRSVKNLVDNSQDRVYLWLNPQATFVQTGPSSANYSLTTVNGEPIDILSLSIADLQNPSQIPPSECNPYTLDGVTVPGVCSICANPSSCTAADFAPIAGADQFASGSVALVYNGCTSDNRYCYVSSTSMQPPDPNGNPVNNSFTASDSNLATQTFSQQLCHYVAYGGGGGLDLLGAFTLTQRDTTRFTWCDSQSVGSSSGTTNQAAVSLGTSTVGCFFGVDVYEDTAYHTFVPVPASTPPSACGQ